MTTPTKAPDPETLERPKRRQHTAEFKLKILGLTDHVSPGERGAVLRKYGLYGSHLTVWRRARESGTLGALAKKRGPKADPRQAEFEQLGRENARLRRKLEVAELIIDAQKKPHRCSGSYSTRQILCARTNLADRDAGRPDRAPAGL